MNKGRKMAVMGILAGVLVAANAMSSFAGEWKQDDKGWWYQKDDRSWYCDGWQWIDGNGDGVSECYYFTNDGYVLTNTTTPDGYTVNGDGAWVENGSVKTQKSSQANENIDQYDYWVKCYGIRIKKNPAFQGITRMVLHEAGFRYWVEFKGFDASNNLDTGISWMVADRLGKSDEEVRKDIYKQLESEKYTVKEYDANGSHWMAYEDTEKLANGKDYYEVMAMTYTSGREYAVFYLKNTEDGTPFSVEELLDKVVVSDDVSENWINTEEGSRKALLDSNNTPIIDFRLKQ